MSWFSEWISCRYSIHDIFLSSSFSAGEVIFAEANEGLFRTGKLWVGGCAQWESRHDALIDLEYAMKNAPAMPTPPARRMALAKPPFPTLVGETRSIRSSDPGMMAPNPAPYSQSDGLAYPTTRLKWLKRKRVLEESCVLAVEDWLRRLRVTVDELRVLVLVWTIEGLLRDDWRIPGNQCSAAWLARRASPFAARLWLRSWLLLRWTLSESCFVVVAAGLRLTLFEVSAKTIAAKPLAHS